MEKLSQLYEGKAKKVFATNDPDIVIVSYKDDATAFNGEKKGTIVGKGVVNNRMSNYLMEKLEKIPEPGDELKADGIYIKVTKSDDRRVLEVYAEKLPDEAEADD